MKEDGENKIWPGRHVELEIHYSDGEIEHLSLDVVPDSSADFDRGFLGESTLLAQAILGQVAGSTVVYSAGRVKILKVSQASAQAPADAARKREEAIQNAVEDSNRTSVILFASSFNGKWGDYDPAGLQGKEDSSSDDNHDEQN